MSKLRKLTNEEKGWIYSKCSNEGLSYYIQNWGLEDFKDTEFYEKLKTCDALLSEIDEEINSYEKFAEES